MTNTHINVGGHKITTNKVGQVHTAQLESGMGGTVKWVVTNGICNVSSSGFNYPNTGGAEYIVAKNMPKAKIFGYSDLAIPGGLINYMLIREGTTNLLVASNNTSTGRWFSFSYPVADDWVES